MSRNILNLLPNAVGQGQLNIVYAEVAPPAPTSFSDPLFVYLVDWTTDFSVRVDSWNADHGSTLPAVGSPCQLVKDSRENWRCVWWNPTSITTPLAIDGSGKSLALQLLSSLKLRLAFGTAQVTFTIADGVHSSIATIPHGLGNSPSWYMGWLDVANSSTNAQYTVQSTSPADATNIHLWAITTVAPGGTFMLPVNWLALG